MSEADASALAAVSAFSAEQLLGAVARPDADRVLLAAVAGDDAWMKRCPRLATAIFTNPRASMAIAHRALRTCARGGFAPPDLEGFDELARAASDDAGEEPLGGGQGAEEQEARERGLAELMSDVPPVSHAEPDPEPEVDPQPEPEAERPRRPAAIDFTKLKLFEKVRLATLGNANTRQTLLRDPNRMVCLAAIRSPQLTDGEIVKAAANRAVSEEVIRYISNRKEMVKLYGVRLALVGNPKCALGVALRLLPTLQSEDVKRLARSKNVPGALALAAKRLAATRGAQ